MSGAGDWQDAISEEALASILRRAARGEAPPRASAAVEGGARSRGLPLLDRARALASAVAIRQAVERRTGARPKDYPGGLISSLGHVQKQFFLWNVLREVFTDRPPELRREEMPSASGEGFEARPVRFEALATRTLPDVLAEVRRAAWEMRESLERVRHTLAQPFPGGRPDDEDDALRSSRSSTRSPGPPPPPSRRPPPPRA